MGIHDTIEVGSQIDSYRIEAPISRSGMASIFRAVDVRDNRVVALKIPHPDMEADPSFLIGSSVKRTSAKGSIIPW